MELCCQAQLHGAVLRSYCWFMIIIDNVQLNSNVLSRSKSQLRNGSSSRISVKTWTPSPKTSVNTRSCLSCSPPSSLAMRALSSWRPFSRWAFTFPTSFHNLFNIRFSVSLIGTVSPVCLSTRWGSFCQQKSTSRRSSLLLWRCFPPQTEPWGYDCCSRYAPPVLCSPSSIWQGECSALQEGK